MSPETRWCGTPMALGSDLGQVLETLGVPKGYALQRDLGPTVLHFNQMYLLYGLVLGEVFPR